MMKNLLRASLIAPLLATAIAIPVLAQNTNENQNTSNTNVTTNTNASTNTNAPVIKDKPKKKDRFSSVNGACMSAAVDKRDTSVIAAVDAYAASTKTALTARKDGLKAAWLLEEGRANAIKAVWKTYRTSLSAAHKALRVGRQGAWKTFKTEAKVCGNGAASADAEGEGLDSQL